MKAEDHISKLMWRMNPPSTCVKVEEARHSEAARFRVPVNQVATAEYAAANNTS